MPKKPLGQAPFPPVLCFDEDREFTVADLVRILRERPDGVSLCIRYPAGPPERGGYFFHFCRALGEGQEYRLCDFEKTQIGTFSPEDLVSLINHCSGRRFDEGIFLLFQTQLNFRSDPDGGV